MLVCFFILVSFASFLGGDLSLCSILDFWLSFTYWVMLLFYLPSFYCRFDSTRLIMGPVSVRPLDLIGDLILDVFFRQKVDDLGFGLNGLILGLTLRKGSLNCFLAFLMS